MSQAVVSPVAAQSLRYRRGFASRLCLILERYLNIPDHQVEAPDPLVEAIAFLQRAHGNPRTLEVNVGSDASALVQRVIQRLAEKGVVERETTVNDFCAFAIRTLNGLIQRPRRVTPAATQQLHDFFCTMESVVDQLAAEQSDPVFAARRIG